MASRTHVALALVSQVEELSSEALKPIAAALEKQARNDLARFWHVEASVAVFRTATDVPAEFWPIIVRDDIGVRGAAGIHLDKDGQPFALVTYSEGWSLTASHQCLSMLVDP